MNNEYLSVHSSVDNPTITNPLFANVKCKDAIVDRIKDKCGRRPDSGSGNDRSRHFSVLEKGQVQYLPRHIGRTASKERIPEGTS